MGGEVRRGWGRERVVEGGGGEERTNMQKWMWRKWRRKMKMKKMKKKCRYEDGWRVDLHMFSSLDLGQGGDDLELGNG